MHTVHDWLSSDPFWHPLLLMLSVAFVVFLLFVAILVICGDAVGDAIIGAGFGVLVFVAVGILVAKVVVASGMQAGSDAAASSQTASDVRLCDGRAVGSLMRDPRDGSWPVTYRDSDGAERPGRMEITDSQSGSPTLRMKDNAGRPLHPSK